MYKSFLCLFISILLFNACKKDREPIDAELAPYIDRFIAEANKRDITLNLEDLEAFIVPEIVSNGTILCGQGFSPALGDSFKAITISSLCWRELDESGKEILIFHELGHALLERGHRNAKLGTGKTLSLMFNGGGCTIEDSYDLCQTELRSYYLDELFFEPIEIPQWSASGGFTVQLFEDTIDEEPFEWEIETEANGSVNGFIFHRDSIEFLSPPYALSITQTTSSSSTSAYWRRSIPYRGFEFCANLRITGQVKTENLGNGSLEMIANIPDSTNTAICSYPLTIKESARSIAGYERFSYEIRCIPTGRREMELKFRLQGNGNAKVVVDNLVLTIYD